MRLAALVSGGKDSLYAAYLAIKDHEAANEIKYIVSIISENPESYMFHVPNAALVAKQAESMQLPLIQKSTKGEKEKELNDLKNVLAEIRNEIDGVVAGAIESNYQKKRIEHICSELDLQLIAPLWHKEPAELLRSMLSAGFEIIITAVAAPPLDEKWLGRKIDEQCISDLIKLNKNYGIHIAFEGGEAESFVLFCPMFNKRVDILDSTKHWDVNTRAGWLEIKKVRLVDI